MTGQERSEGREKKKRKEKREGWRVEEFSGHKDLYSSCPNFFFPLQPNDVNGPQPCSRRVSREEKKRERNRERGLLVTSVTAEAISKGIIPYHSLAYLRRLDVALPLLGDPIRSIILQQVISEPGSDSSAPASDNSLLDLRSSSDLASEVPLTHSVLTVSLFLLFLLIRLASVILLNTLPDSFNDIKYAIKYGRDDSSLSDPNFSFPLQPNDVNGPQPWSRLFLTGSRDARAVRVDHPGRPLRVSCEEKKRERNREIGLPVTSVTVEAISKGIIADHPLAYLRCLDTALPLLGDCLHFW
ncbi:hypothetical protein M9H77_08403 [Catharanthus roseus]|uniref:Uncharacterized protein n=1 Tax=Catharanthus roseus TaxID=4058 RepID=A0ACC0BXP5_CATRO|nr:hypothetical protein M9H77_08403 [Catharanthus roseus]